MAKRRKTDERETLTPERVLRAGVELADAEGLDALTMRRLGETLGVQAMSLYNHVANKHELLDGMVDIVYTEIAPPDPDAPWRDAVRAVAVSKREVLSRHPWATTLMEARLRPGPANLGHHDAMLGVFREAGFSLGEAVSAFNLLDSYVYGFALQQVSLPFQAPEDVGRVAELMLAQFPTAAYPYLGETVTEFLTSGYDYAAEFEFGLDLIIDGLDRVVGPQHVRHRDATRRNEP